MALRVVLLGVVLLALVGAIGVLVLMDLARRRKPDEPEQDAW
jgi:hypothetical protein